MGNAEELFRETAEKALGLAVSIFTLTCEDRDEHTDSTLVARQLVADIDDPRLLGQALSFACKLLSDFITPDEMIAAKAAVIEKAIAGLRHDG